MTTNEIIRLCVVVDDLKTDLLTLLSFLAYCLSNANQPFESYDVLSKTEALAMLAKYESLLVKTEEETPWHETAAGRMPA